MTLEEAIKHAEAAAIENEKEAKRNREHGGWFYDSEAQACSICAEQHRQLSEWLKILKKAKFEYDEAHRIITCPTPDVTSYDKNRAQVILETFRGSLGKIEYES
jgi:hypothetical protein